MLHEDYFAVLMFWGMALVSILILGSILGGIIMELCYHSEKFAKFMKRIGLVKEVKEDELENNHSRR